MCLIILQKDQQAFKRNLSTVNVVLEVSTHGTIDKMSIS